MKKTYGSFLLQNFLKQFFFTNQKIQFEVYQNSFFPKFFSDKNFSEKKKETKLFLLFSFFFNFSNSLVFSFKRSEKVLKKKENLTKRNCIFLLIIVSFLKKQKTLENFFSKKKQKKKQNFNSQLNQISALFLFTQNDFYSHQKFFSSDFLNSGEYSVFSENSDKLFLNGLGKALAKKNEKKFLSYPSEKYTQKFLFFHEKKKFLKTSKKLTIQVCNKCSNVQKKRKFEKKQKKWKEFLKSGFVLNTLEKDMKSKNGEINQFSSLFDTGKHSKQSFTFFLHKKNKKNFLSVTRLQKQNQAGSFVKGVPSTREMNKKSSQKLLLQMVQKKNGKNEKLKKLKNPVLTISYNFLWRNDSDWKYFVYYNCLFLSEFEDIPIYEPLQASFSSGDKISQTKKDYFSILEGVDINLPKQTQVGAGILEKLLTEYTPPELKKMIKQHQILLPKINQIIHSSKQLLTMPKKESLKIQKYIQKREHIVRRLKFLRKFFRKNSNPTFMILRNLPVLPPDLRPILKLQNQIAASDLNRFYQRIIYRNERLKKFSKDSATNQSFELRYAQRLLQEAVDNLIQNGKGGVKPETNSRGIPLKSLSEVLKGKQGRFRQYLLGKRVDYSGRSVIVVGPKLKLYECGLPREMAFELFLPFLIQQILQLNLSKTVIGAKNLLKKDSTLSFYLLKKIMKNIPVLLNRAPTLHRLGFQAFLPKLIEGRAILLHPMVCPGFNADFDGDQMAVHVPLTVEARTEAWKFMLSTNNFINSATGDPVLLPTQDMVLGLYYLTTDFQSKSAAVHILNFLRKSETNNFYNFQKNHKNFSFFSNFSDVLYAYERKEISLHSPIWVRWSGFVDFGNDSMKPLEIQVRKNGSWQQITPKITTFSNQKSEILSKFIRTTPGRIFMNFMIHKFHKK